MFVFHFIIKTALLFIFLSLLSCDNDVEITHVNPIILSIEDAETFRIEDGCYESVFILDSFLIMNAHCDSNKIHVFNKENLQLITKFGTGGMAPFELPYTHPLNNSSITQKNDHLLFYDLRVFQFKTINLEKYLTEGNIAECITSVPMDKALFFSIYLSQLDMHKFAARSTTPMEGTFFIYDTLKKEKKYIGYESKNKLDERTNLHIYFGELNANGSKNSMVFASRFFDQVMFYDLEGNLQKKHVFSPLKMPELPKQFPGPLKKLFTYAYSTYATSDFCFVHRACQLFSSDIEQPLKPSQILVFTWNGVLVNAFELPAISPTSRPHICFDEEYGYLYSFYTSMEVNDPHIVVRKYKINDYLLIDEK